MTAQKKKIGEIIAGRFILAVCAAFVIAAVMIFHETAPSGIETRGTSNSKIGPPAQVERPVGELDNPSQWRAVPAIVDPLKGTLPRAPAVDHSNPYQALLSIPPNIRTKDGGSFEIDKTLYRIAQIQPLPLRMLCTNPSGARWGCGQRGRMALRTLLINKTLQCRPWKADANPIDLDCQLNSVPVGALIVSAGWAVPADGAPEAIVKAAEKAQADKAGAWASVEGARP